MGYQHIQVPAGDKITVNADNSLNVPNNPIIPFIEGDGIGVDVTPMIDVIDAAVEKPTAAKRKFLGWKFSAARSQSTFMAQTSGCPKNTEALKEFKVSIKGL